MGDEERSPEPRPMFGRVVARAVASPVNLGVAGAAAAGAAALHLWPIAALGGVAYVALVAWDLASPDFWKKAIPQTSYGRPELASFPDPKRLVDPVLKQMAVAIRNAGAELRHVLADASRDVAAQLTGMMTSVNELEGRAASLIQNGEQLSRYLTRIDASAVDREIDRLRATIALTTDPSARKQYEETVAAREDQKKTLGDLRAAVERVQANLSRILATLEGLSAKVVRMGAMDSQAMDNLSGDMNAELFNMNREIDTFEETLRHLVSAEVR